jgi:hypothetical protein
MLLESNKNEVKRPYDCSSCRFTFGGCICPYLLMGFNFVSLTPPSNAKDVKKSLSEDKNQPSEKCQDPNQKLHTIA